MLILLLNVSLLHVLDVDDIFGLKHFLQLLVFFFKFFLCFFFVLVHEFFDVFQFFEAEYFSYGLFTSQSFLLAIILVVVYLINVVDDNILGTLDLLHVVALVIVDGFEGAVLVHCLHHVHFVLFHGELLYQGADSERLAQRHFLVKYVRQTTSHLGELAAVSIYLFLNEHEYRVIVPITSGVLVLAQIVRYVYLISHVKINKKQFFG